MSVLLSGTASLQRAALSALGSTHPSTVCGWYRATSGSGFRTLFALHTASDSTSRFAEFNNTGLEVYQDSGLVGNFGGGIHHALDTWRFFALVTDAAGAFKFYSGPSGAVSLVTSTGTFSSAIVPTRLLIGENAQFGEQWVGQVESVKAWAAELTEAELLAEMPAGDAVRTSNLVGAWNLRTADASGYTDSSGNGNTLAVRSGTPTTDASDAPVSYGSGDQAVLPGVAALTLTALRPAVALPAEPARPLGRFPQQSARFGRRELTKQRDGSLADATRRAFFTGAGFEVTPGVSVLTLTALSPTVVLAVQFVETDQTPRLTLTALEPTVTPQSVSVAPPALALALSAPAPTVTPPPASVEPPVLVLGLSALDPSVAPGAATIAPNRIRLTMLQLQPTVGRGPVDVAPTGPAALTLAALAPSVAPGDVEVAPDVAQLALVLLPPVVSEAETFVVAPDVALLPLEFFPPLVTAGSLAVAPDPLVLGLAALEPSVAPGPVTALPDALLLALQVNEPSVTSTVDVSPDLSLLALALPPPSVTALALGPGLPAGRKSLLLDSPTREVQIQGAGRVALVPSQYEVLIDA